MNKNLTAKSGTVVHAPAATDRNPVLCSNMRRASGYETIEAGFATTDAPVTCKNCCRKLGIEAPKSLSARKVAKKAAPVERDAQADAETSRAATIERAEFEVTFEGGTVADQLHVMAIALYGFTKAARHNPLRMA